MTIPIRSFAPLAVLTVLLAAIAVAARPAVAQVGGGPAVFPVEALNDGLGEPPTGLDRSTPQATLEAMFMALDRGDNARAAHILDLRDLPADEQSQRGPLLAYQLGRVIERKVRLDYRTIPDRPDGMETVGSSRQPMVGQPRKSLSLATLNVGRFIASIRLNRVQAGDAAPVWVFSPQTVEHIPALYDRYGPTALERAMPNVLRQQVVFGLQGWELIAIPLILALAIALGAFAWWAVMALSSRILSEQWQVGVRRMRLPAILVLVGLFLQAATSTLFVFSAGIGAVFATLFWTMIVTALVVAASRILDTIMEFASNRYIDTIDDPANTWARHWYTNMSAVKRIGVIAAVIVGMGFAISALNVFESFGMSLLVSAGVATAIFGLAAQTILGNIIASLQLAIAQPIRIGDAIYFNDVWSYVEKINYTFVQLRTWDGKRYIVPVKEFVSTPFENWTKEDPQLIMPVHLKLDHRADVEALRRVFAEAAAADGGFSTDAEPKVQVVDHDDDGMTVRFYCTADDPTSAWELHCRMREALLAQLTDAEESAPVLPRTRYTDLTPSVGSRKGGRSTTSSTSRSADKTTPKSKKSGGGEEDKDAEAA